MSLFKKFAMFSGIFVLLVSIPAPALPSDDGQACQEDGMEPYFNFTIVTKGKKSTLYDEWNNAIFGPWLHVEREYDNIVSRFYYAEERIGRTHWITQIRGLEYLAVCIDKYEVVRTKRLRVVETGRQRTNENEGPYNNR